jgi:hypothetical protein
MDKKLLLDFSKIIRDIESKNLHKEADTLNSCLIRLAQLSDQNESPEEVKPSTEPSDTIESNYSTNFIIEFNDFVNKTTTFTQKAKNISIAGKITPEEMQELNGIIEQGNNLVLMKEATGEDAKTLEGILNEFTKFKSNYENKL